MFWLREKRGGSMQIVNENTIVFKSKEHFFALEKSGMKPNTMRILGYKAYVQVEARKKKLKYIRIVNAFQKDQTLDFFERELTDISHISDILGHSLVAFSWRHKEE